ncbi:MAG: hypothetical protein HXX11_22830 [Desulfuromonadales bacterium]|nr:hypothetical protein [Desulfuromonadales bacterium]
MKTSALVVMSAFLMSAAVPVFAMTHQERLACAMTAGNCLDDEKNLEKQKIEIKNETDKGSINSSDEIKKPEKKLRNTMERLDNIKG